MKPANHKACAAACPETHLINTTVSREVPHSREDNFEGGLLPCWQCRLHQDGHGTHIPQAGLATPIRPPGQVPQHTGSHLKTTPTWVMASVCVFNHLWNLGLYLFEVHTQQKNYIALQSLMYSLFKPCKVSISYTTQTTIQKHYAQLWHN